MIPLEYICFTTHVGHAIAARNYILALHQMNKYDIRIVPIDRPFSKMIVGDNYNTLNSLCHQPEKPDAIQIYHCIPDMFRRIKRKNKALAVIAFEASQVPSRWLEIVNTLNAVIVPSEFNVKAFEGISVPIHCVPHCLDLDLYQPGVTSRNEFREFTFLFCGTWKERKGYKLLLQAWKEEFCGKNKALLAIKTDDTKHAECYVKRLFGEVPEDIRFIREVLTDDQMPSFYKSFDCLVSPTKGEGFGLPGLQSLAVGVPIIITNYSGVTEYANKDNAYLLEPAGFETIKGPMDGYYQLSGCRWPFIRLEDLKQSMRLAMEKKKIVGQLSRQFGYNEVAKKMDGILKEI